MNGKGDSPRPVDREKYESNFDQIQWNNRRERDCKVCSLGCRYFQKTRVVCFPCEEQQEPEPLHLCDKGKTQSKGES